MFIVVNLPWPPSVNHYLGRNGKHSYLSKKAKDYRSEVRNLIDFTYEHHLIRVGVKLYPPDNRRRDIDNYLKQLFDALQYAEAFEDDSQIKMLCVEMCPKHKGGLVTISFGLY